MGIENLTIIGTSHIAKQSIEEIKNSVAETKPDIIALELDNKRLYALIHEKKSSGILPWILKTPFGKTTGNTFAIHLILSFRLLILH